MSFLVRVITYATVKACYRFYGKPSSLSLRLHPARHTAFRGMRRCGGYPIPRMKTFIIAGDGKGWDETVTASTNDSNLLGCQGTHKG